MKCDELKPYLVGYERQYYVYDATSVEEAIAELKQKLEDAKASHYAEMVDAGMRERRLRRGLWLAHAYKAKFKKLWLYLTLDCEMDRIRRDTETLDRIREKIGNCKKSERKCRAKAEEYK